MNPTRFLVDAISTALSLGLATPDDVLQHVTCDVLAEYLPRPIWSKLLTAALSATRFDSRVVVDTVGVTDLCEHMPKHLLWACVAEFAQRALGRPGVASVASSARTSSFVSQRASSASMMAEADPPRPAVVASLLVSTAPAAVVSSPNHSGESSIDSISDLAASLGDVLDPPRENKQPTRPPARAGLSTRMGASSRKPQSLAPSATPGNGRSSPVTVPQAVRRGQTEMESADADFAEVSTRVPDDANAVDNDAIEDEQLVDWQPS